MPTISHVYGSTNEAGTVPISTARKLDRTDILFWKWRNHSEMLYLLRKMMKKKSTRTPKMYAWETGEKIQSGTLEGADPDNGDPAAITTGLVTLKLASPGDDVRVAFQKGDLFGIRYDQTNNSNYDDHPDIGMEVCEVLKTYTSNSVHIVQVIRGVGKSAATTNVTAESGNAVEWVSLMNYNAEASGARIPKQDTPAEDYVVCQIGKEFYGYAGSFNDADLYFSEKARNAKVQIDKFFNDWDRSVWMQTMEERFIGDFNASKMGGVIPWLNNQWATTCDSNIDVWSTTNDLLTGNGTSRITRLNSNLTINKLYDFSKAASTYGNGKNKKVFVDYGTATELSKILEGKYEITRTDERFGLDIFKFNNPSLPFTFIRSSTLDRIEPYSMIVLDFDHLMYRFLVNKKVAGNVYSGNRDIKLVNIPATDVDMDRYALFGELCIQPTVKAAHAMMTKIIPIIS